jgi:hypothetical protein
MTVEKMGIHNITPPTPLSSYSTLKNSRGETKKRKENKRSPSKILRK